MIVAPALFALIALLPATTLAAGLPSPTGPVILSVSGNIQHTNAEGSAQFDRAMLERLGLHLTETTTPWTDGPVRFEGPLGRTLLEAVGATGQSLKVIALNDYSAVVPVVDFYEQDTILALKMNGTDMRVRDKGPIFIIYPFDQIPELNNEVYYSRSVWQIRSIIVE